MTTTKIYDWSKPEKIISNPTGISAMQPLHLCIRDSHGGVVGETELEDQDSCRWMVTSRYDWKTAPIKSQRQFPKHEHNDNIFSTCQHG